MLICHIQNEPICYIFSFHAQISYPSNIKFGIWDGFEEPCPINWLVNGPQPAYLQSNECSTDQNNPKYLPVGEDYLTIQLNCLNRLYPPASFNKDMQDTFNQTHLTCVLRNHLEASVVNVSYLPSLGLPRGEKWGFPVQPPDKDLAPL